MAFIEEVRRVVLNETGEEASCILAGAVALECLQRLNRTGATAEGLRGKIFAPEPFERYLREQERYDNGELRFDADDLLLIGYEGPKSGHVAVLVDGYYLDATVGQMRRTRWPDMPDTVVIEQFPPLDQEVARPFDVGGAVALFWIDEQYRFRESRYWTEREVVDRLATAAMPRIIEEWQRLGAPLPHELTATPETRRPMLDRLATAPRRAPRARRSTAEGAKSTDPPRTPDAGDGRTSPNRAASSVQRASARTPPSSDRAKGPGFGLAP